MCLFMGLPGRKKVSEIQQIVQHFVPEPALTKVDSERVISPSDLIMLDSARLGAFDACVFEKANLLKSKYARFVVFGVGGSSLGGQVIQACSASTAIRFIENIDPHEMMQLCSDFDPRTTGVVVISKSGYTPETIAQLLSLAQVYHKRGCSDRLADIIILSTDIDTPLRRFARKQRCHFIPHDPEIGGRFSIFSSTGAIIAALVDFDMAQFREGAQTALKNLKDLTGAGHFLQATQRTISNHVCMYYGDRLRSLAHWYRQLWSESLGKDGKGTELSISRGVVDQHSQLQLYLDGPQSNYFTFLCCAKTSQALPIMVSDDPELAFLSGKSVGDLFHAEKEATIQELEKKGAPVRVITLRDTPFVWGNLCGMLMAEVVLIAKNLGVDPFNQPAVESGKIRTRNILEAR